MPTESKAPAAPATAPEQGTQIDPSRSYILILPGSAVVGVRAALDAVGRGAGADAGAPFWQLRGVISDQVINADRVEAEAAGLIAGRDAQRAAAKAEGIKKDSVQAVAQKTAARRKK